MRSSSVIPTKNDTDTESEESDTNVEVQRLSAAYEHMNSSAFRNKILLQLETTTIQMAEVLYLCYYDVNQLICTYLTFWSNDCSIPFIPEAFFYSSFPDQYQKLLKSYFQYSYGHITCNDYIQFSLLFSFFDLQCYLPLLFSMCSIHSNVIITDTQIITFFQHLNLSTGGIESILSQIDHSSSTNSYEQRSMKAFQTFLLKYEPFLTYFKKFKNLVMNMTIPITDYRRIINRIHFYHQGHTYEPPESCILKVGRIICGNKPPPYHYDYSSPVAPEQIVATLRTNYGYNKRSSVYGSLYSTHNNNNNNNCSMRSSSRRSVQKMSRLGSTLTPMPKPRGTIYNKENNVFKNANNNDSLILSPKCDSGRDNSKK